MKWYMSFLILSLLLQLNVRSQDFQSFKGNYISYNINNYGLNDSILRIIINLSDKEEKWIKSKVFSIYIKQNYDTTGMVFSALKYYSSIVLHPPTFYFIVKDRLYFVNTGMEVLLNYDKETLSHQLKEIVGTKLTYDLNSNFNVIDHQATFDPIYWEIQITHNSLKILNNPFPPYAPPRNKTKIIESVEN
jgi:hypothetical protein